MTDKNTNSPQCESSDTAKTPGFFGRIFTKLDDSMKQKAEEKSPESCCGGKDDKGNKCC
ncbi:MAG: hypothetical protein ACLFU4_10215 [Opitutales bacterium]